MKFLVDAQLPKTLSDLFTKNGLNSIHTLELAKKNFTTDSAILEIAEKENRIVVTKDTDFLDTFLIIQKPSKLIIVKTGNIKNSALLSIFEQNLEAILSLLTESSLLEIYTNEIVAHA